MQRLYQYLPLNILNMIKNLDNEISAKACELRLRRGGSLSLSTYTKNLFITPNGEVTFDCKKAYSCNEQDITSTLSRLTENSVYRYMNTINSGYIVTPDGIRVGVVGEGVYDSGRLSSVIGFSSLNIRIPHEIADSGDRIVRFLRENPNTSLLLFAPAGYGKTTVIRSVAKSLATGKLFTPKRVAVIDERGEILPDGSIGLCDRLLGYSKPDGIEIAVRLFSPDYVICDEIGLFDDTRAILSVQNTGIPFIATTHGKSLEEIKLRPNINELITHRVFGAFAGLDRIDGSCVTVFEEGV